MGYTHYTRNLKHTEAAWEKVCEFAGKVFQYMESKGVVLLNDQHEDEEKVPPLVTSEQIRFNGMGRDSHETFILNRMGEDFEFCKTARKPYDLAVSAILIYSSSMSHDGEISSDGIVGTYTDREWYDAWMLTRLIAPELADDPAKTFKAFRDRPDFDNISW